MKDVSIYLNDIVTNISICEGFIKDMAQAEFIKDSKTNYAVVRCLEIIGEAARHIPTALRNKYPEVPWKTIVGTRNIIIHEYAIVDMEEVWKSATCDLPPLKNQIVTILTELR